MTQIISKSLSLISMVGLLYLASPICHADFTAAEIDAMLAAHNQVRTGVVPTATNMTRLVWDSNLATVAQNWANQCNFSHNGGRNADYAALSSNPGSVGENIFVTSRSRAEALNGSNSAVTSWASEVAEYNFSTNSCIPGGVCGHYTQLVWANTRRVGCGVTQCTTIIGLSSGFNNGQLVVCDYNPAGNFNGLPPYTAGSTGSQCPTGLPNVVAGLCSTAESSSIPTKSVPALPTVGLILFGGLLWRLGRAFGSIL